MDNLYGLDAIDESAFHLYSAIFGYEYASYIAKKIKESSPSDPYSIGIVCPYKQQADSIKLYYEPSSLYEVRKDDTAVDIQINEQFR